jgi:rod shape-determining protein MreC
MESFFSRYRNSAVLALVLLAQVIGLAVQLKRPLDPNNPDAGTVRLLRSWVIGAITPVEKVFVSSTRFMRRTWHDYINVVGLRMENRDLREQNEKLHMELARQSESASQAERLQVLLEFKQNFLGSTLAAQVIGSSGSDSSRVVYIDKGTRDGLKPNMAVITPHGIVGKLRDVYRSSAQVLMFNDSSSGVGAILEDSRLHGVVKGTPAGEIMLVHIQADEKVQPGEKLVTSGGDRIYPKGLPIGTVSDVSPGAELFLNVRVKPAANLTRLEEVLVITQTPDANLESAEGQTPVRASDILAQRLPSVPKKPETPSPKADKKTTPGQASAPDQTAAATVKRLRPPASAGADSAASAANSPKNVVTKPNRGAVSRVATENPAGSSTSDGAADAPAITNPDTETPSANKAADLAAPAATTPPEKPQAKPAVNQEAAQPPPPERRR